MYHAVAGVASIGRDSAGLAGYETSYKAVWSASRSLGIVPKYQADWCVIMAGNAVITAVTASLCLFSGASAWPFSKRQSLSIGDIQTQALANANKVLAGTLNDGMTRGAGCTKDSVAVRKE